MRTDPVPCKNATRYEIEQGKHVTWNEDRHCNPCKRLFDTFAQRRQQGEAIAQAEEAAEAREEIDESYSMWNTGVCSMCGGAGILGVKNNAHPSMYGQDCPQCQTTDEGETP